MPGIVKRLSSVLAGLALVTGLASVDAATKPAPETLIRTSYVHTAWSVHDGAPISIWSIAQSIDGWLWLATPTGLFRFDGDRFERIDPEPAEHRAAPRAVRSILAATTGDVWVGFSMGGASLLRQADPRSARSFPGLPAGAAIIAFCESGDGQVWAGTSDGLFEFRGDRWTDPQPSWQLPEGGIADCHLDTNGALWASSPEGMVRLARGGQAFERVKTDADVSVELLFGQSGGMWTRRKDGEFRRLAGEGTVAYSNGPPYLHSVQPSSAIQVRDGSLWRVNCKSGVCRSTPGVRDRVTPADFAADSFGKADGLTSDNAMTLYEDREGTIWVGTKLGLDSFRRSAAWRVPFPAPLTQFSIGTDADGATLIGTESTLTARSRHVWRVDGALSFLPGFDHPIGAMHRESDGSMLMAGSEGLFRRSGQSVQPLALPPEIAGKAIRFMTRSAGGDLWLATRYEGLFRLRDGRWLHDGGIEALPEATPIGVATDSTGGVWFGYADGAIVEVRADHAIRHDQQSGLTIGAISSIDTGAPLLAVGQGGLAVREGSRFRTLALSNPESIAGVTGMARGADGTLWINANRGLLRIDRESLERAMHEPDFAMPVRVFDADDGLMEGPQTTTPSVVRDDDGVLWIAQLEGVVRLDPARVPHNELAPPVVIRSISSGDTRFAIDDGLQLPAGTRDLRLQFTALSLSVPARVQFRVKLDGIDPDWKSIGNRREIAYSNLRPGHYAFHVLASNGDGVWNETGSSLAFDIRAHFYETWWFACLVVAAIVALLACLQRLHGRRLAARIAGREAERTQEREQLSRDLHDSLLQDMGALVLNLRGLQERKASAEAIQAELKDLGQSADRLLSEARDRVSGLRSSAAGAGDPVVALQAAAEQFHASHPVAFTVSSLGEARPLNTSVADQLVLIGREALSNAFRHARAGRIDVLLDYRPRELVLSVSDDGIGFAAFEHRPDHWGVIGMRERANQLGAVLTIQSPAAGGTELCLRLPSAAAYAS
ncbi:sensor histidine kinase [soil metagenome]